MKKNKENTAKQSRTQIYQMTDLYQRPGENYGGPSEIFPAETWFFKSSDFRIEYIRLVCMSYERRIARNAAQPQILRRPVLGCSGGKCLPSVRLLCSLLVSLLRCLLFYLLFCLPLSPPNLLSHGVWRYGYLWISL